MPRAIAPEVTITTRSPPRSSAATCSQTESSTSARSSPSSAATIEEPSLTTRVMAGQVYEPRWRRRAECKLKRTLHTAKIAISRPQDSRLPYLPGIDALRAIAVLAVFLYHAGVGWMPGGFLGVDVFFVISGYLITSLLLGEYRRGGHIRLGRFWLRRARRLLPAVGVLIAVTMVVAAIVEPDRIDGAARRRDRLARLRRQLALHPRPPVLLRPVPARPRSSATSGRSRSRSSSTSSGRSSSPPG